MPGKEFFARMGPQFAEHAGTARENMQRQADVERLIAKAEYECVQVRRELAELLALEVPPGVETEAAPQDAEVALGLIKAA
jgi:hypothetical protein